MILVEKVEHGESRKPHYQEFPHLILINESIFYTGKWCISSFDSDMYADTSRIHSG